MGQGSEIAGEAGLPAGESPSTALAMRGPHPLRVMAFNALRFASVLIGAGLLLRTASAEHVVSAPQEPSRQPDTRQPQRLAPAALPQPAFGAAEPGLRASAETAASPVAARLRPHHVRHAKSEALALAPVGAASVEPAQGPALTAAAPASHVAAPAKLAAATPAFGKSGPARGAAAKAAPSATPRAEPASGLLTPVRIASGAPAARPAPVLAPAPVAQQPVPQPAAPQVVQISLAAPVMRPGPRTTALTTDVRAAMNRPASAWDYAEALPPELTGRPAAAPRTAAVAPPARGAAPAPAAAQPLAHAAAEPARVVLREKSAKTLTTAVPAPSLAAPVAAASPASAGKTVAAVTAAAARQAAPARLALLDVPPVPREHHADHRTLAVAAPKAVNPGRTTALVLGRSARPPQPLGDDRRARLLQREQSGQATDVQSGRDDGEPDARATSGLARVSAAPAGGAGGAELLGDASGSDGGGSSLRDRMPLPAFGMPTP